MQLNLHEVLRLTQAASRKWHDLGLLLGISESTLETIEKDHHDAQSSFREVISVWLSAPSASWEVLIEALRNPSVELSVIAHQIQLELEPGMFSVSGLFSHNDYFDQPKSSNLVWFTQTMQPFK